MRRSRLRPGIFVVPTESGSFRERSDGEGGREERRVLDGLRKGAIILAAFRSCVVAGRDIYVYMYAWKYIFVQYVVFCFSFFRFKSVEMSKEIGRKLLPAQYVPEAQESTD